MSLYSATTNSQIWMGSLEPYMTEKFIMEAFRTCGETPIRVKRMKSRLTASDPTSGYYCFVHFETEEKARKALNRLNGTTIPKTSPPLKYQLNFSLPTRQLSSPDDEYTLHVGNLSPDVDDHRLFKCFAAKYRSLRSAKVIRDVVGISKGYAFIKFSIEADTIKCKKEMNGFVGLGSNAIKISSAIRPLFASKVEPPVTPVNSNVTIIPTDGVPQFEYNPNIWQSYSWQDRGHRRNASYNALYQPPLPLDGRDIYQLIDHTPEVRRPQDTNEALLNRDVDFWDAIENSKWSPVDAESGYINALT